MFADYNLNKNEIRFLEISVIAHLQFIASSLGEGNGTPL